jgi:DNA-binding CsgD family transcriptional regulator
MTREPWKSPDWLEPDWTDRQLEVLRLIARGRTNPEISEDLGVSFAGAKWHVSEVLSKLGVRSRDDAAAYWRWHTSRRVRAKQLMRGFGTLTMGKVVAVVTLTAGVTIVAALAAVMLAREDEPGDLARAPSPSAAPATATPNPTPTGISPQRQNEIVANAAELLAKSLGATPADFELSSFEAAVWDDDCLGLTWPGRDCSGPERPGARMEFRTPNGQPHYVHSDELGRMIWVPIWEVSGIPVLLVETERIVLDISGEFPSELRLAPGTTVVGELVPGAFVYIAAASFALPEGADVLAPAVVIVVLGPAGVAPPGLHEWTARTGIALVDEFIDAVMFNDASTLRSLVTLVGTPCTDEPGGPHPEPGCPPGEPRGAQVEVFLRAACQPHFISDREEARDAIVSLGGAGLFVYSVYEGGFGVPFQDPAAFTVVLGTSLDDVARQVSLDASGRVIGFVTCSSALNPALWTDPGLPGSGLLILPPVSE